MTLSVSINGEPVVDVATNRGWSEFIAWAEKIEGMDELAHLAIYGWSPDADTLRSELRTALENNKPSNDIASIGSALLDNIKNAMGDDTIIVGP